MQKQLRIDRINNNIYLFDKTKMFLCLVTRYKIKYDMIRENANDIGTVIIPYFSIKNINVIKLNALPILYAMPVYFVSLDIDIPEETIGKSKYMQDGIQRSVK